MRVGITIDKFIIGPGLPGIDKVCYNLLLELTNIGGIEVTLFQEKYKEVGEFGKFNVQRFFSLRDLPFAGRPMEGGTSMAGTNTFKPPPAFRLSIKDAIKRWTIERSGVDLLHYPTQLERPYRLHGISSVMTVHDLVPLIFRDMCTDRINWEMSESIKRLHRVDHFISVSNNTKKDMIEILGIREDDISVVYSGVSSTYRPVDGGGMRDRVSGGKPYILFVGTVEPRKNLVTLLKAVAALENDVSLVISGHMGWGYQDVKKTLEEKSLRERVRFTGYMREDQLPSLYSGAELFVYPSWYEGFGLPPLEAMACGTPVASSTGGSLPEILGDAAFYFDPADVEALRHAIQQLLNNQDLRSRLVEKGLQRAGKFTWQNCASEVFDVYRKLI